MGCDSITKITPSHMLEFLLLSARFFALFNLTLSHTNTHLHALTRSLSLSRSLFSSTYFVSEVIKWPSSWHAPSQYNLRSLE